MREKGMTVGRGVVDVAGSGENVGVGMSAGGGERGSESLSDGGRLAASVGLAMHEHDGVLEILPSALEEGGSAAPAAAQPTGTSGH